jgi:hypothetical protein
VGTAAAISAEIKLSLPLGLVVLYVVGALIWYELLRSQLLDFLEWRRRRRRRRGRRRGGRGGNVRAVAARGGVERAYDVEPAEEVGPVQLPHAESNGGASQLGAVDGAADDDERMHYHLARKAAAAERDAAVQAASEATRRAIERIEQRFGQAGSAQSGRVGKAAKAERDAAVKAANVAAKQAIERIERRYREIDWALEDEEEERIRQMLERAER